MNYSIDTEEGMENAVRWMQGVLNTPKPNLVWFIPRVLGTYYIDKVAKTFTRSAIDESTDLVLIHMGFTLRDHNV